MDNETSARPPVHFDRNEWIANALKHHSDRDAEDNLATRPPDGEDVRMLSSTFAEVYFGAQVGVLVNHLDSVDWSDSDDNPPHGVRRATAEGSSTWGNFRLLPAELRSNHLISPAGYCLLPLAATEVYVSYVLVTPKLLLLSSTIVWDDQVSARLDDVLRNDAESRFEVMEDRIVQGSLDFAKRQAISAVREELRTAVFGWVQTSLGTGVLATRRHLKNPFCVLASMRSQPSLKQQQRFMNLLDLVPTSVAFEADADPRFYFIYPHSFNTSAAMWAFVQDSGDVENERTDQNVPYRLHNLVSPLTMVEAIRLSLVDLSIRTEAAGDLLDELSLEHGKDAEISNLRAIQLDLTISLTRFCDGVDELVSHHRLLWGEYPRMQVVDGSIMSDFVPTPVNQMEELSQLTLRIRNQERSLRELVSTTSSAIADRDMLRFTKELKTTTKWLVGLTGLSVAISITALVISAYH
jgi:hypothetical protein